MYSHSPIPVIPCLFLDFPPALFGSVNGPPWLLGLEAFEIMSRLLAVELMPLASTTHGGKGA